MCNSDNQNDIPNLFFYPIQNYTKKVNEKQKYDKKLYISLTLYKVIRYNAEYKN